MQLHRFGKGSGYKGSKLPEKPLVYWGYESSPFCKVTTGRLACAKFQTSLQAKHSSHITRASHDIEPWLARRLLIANPHASLH